MYADIIIDITHERLDKIFQYRVPEELAGTLAVGMEVIVPFGRNDREISDISWASPRTPDMIPRRSNRSLGRRKGRRLLNPDW